MEDQKKRTLEALKRRFAQAKAEVQTQQHKGQKRPIADRKRVALNTESPSVDSTPKRPSFDASSKKGNFSFRGHTRKQDVEVNEPAYLKLSHTVHENLLPDGAEASDGEIIVNRVLHDLLQRGDAAQKYNQGSRNLKIENNILLDNFVPKNGMPRARALPNESKRSKKHMSLKQHKRSGLFDLPKEFHKFEIFKPMHDKWKAYIQQLLKIVGKDQLAQCFLNADLHGAIMLVVQCKIVVYVGIHGIMVRETKETFGIITQDNKFREALLRPFLVPAKRRGHHNPPKLSESRPPPLAVPPSIEMYGHPDDVNSGITKFQSRVTSDLSRILAFYFPQISTGDAEFRFHLTSDLFRFFSSPQAQKFVDQVKEDDGLFFLPLDFEQFRKVCQIEDFYAALDEKPKDALLCMGAAMHKVFFMKEDQMEDSAKINIRLHNYQDSLIALKNLKAAYIGRLVSVRGTVTKVSTVRPLVIQMSFSCAKCGTTITCDFPDGKFSPPTKCEMQACKSRNFNPIRSTARPIDFQKIRIQELLKSEHHEEGRVPRTVECELTEDLVDACIPGDVVTVSGFIRVINNYMDIGGGKSKGKNQALYYLYLEAASVTNSKSQSVPDDMQHTDTNARSAEHLDLCTFSPRDLEFIVKFSEEHCSDVFRQILQSICPSIYGHELVKAGITLSLFGGVRKHSMDQNKVPVRGDIHIIVVGDPGLGKSQLLQAAASVSPRGIYVCGNATTNAGLTVAVVKDHMTGDYAFEAGAMVIADRGLCCIDEFDKMSAEHQALLEAMEQQCVSVAKAGLVASLSARTTVLAAANPVGGHYNRAKTVNENLKMNAALLSRFDLVFILLDKPDELLDKRLSEHIMSLHAGNGQQSPSVKRLCTESRDIRDVDMNVNSGSLVARLTLDPKQDGDFVPLPGPLLRKYIAYARTYVFPRMTKPAADILQKFYLRLRDHNTSSDGTPITARQLESLVRLAEARARVDLREEISTQDALDVVEIMKESLYDKYVDENGLVDFGRSGGMSQQKEAKRFLSALNKQSELQQKDCFSISELYSLADRISLRVPDIDTFVDNLNSVGYLLKKGPKTYQVLSSSYSRSQSSRPR